MDFTISYAPDPEENPAPGLSSHNLDQIPEVQRYLELLYPDPPPDAWLVTSWIDGSNAWCSQWFRIAEIAATAQCMLQHAQGANVYIGLGLRRPECTPDPHTRGKSEDVGAIGGLWVELDHNAGVHAATNLPTPDELLAFINALPFRFSLLVDSGGGMHAYVLFKELWQLDTANERQAAALLLRRFQRTLQELAAQQGWKIDSTADLARVLRPAGTLNHKSGTPQPVTILHEEAIRYNPTDIAEAPWLTTIDDADHVPAVSPGAFPLVPLTPIVDGCAWLRHCRNDATTLPEPEWHGMLGIIGRCQDGEQIAHAWSQPYPRYTKEETAQKLQHALEDAGPRTCNTIRFDLGGDAHCRDCQHWQRIKSPIQLGMARMVVSSGNGQASNSQTVQLDVDVHEAEAATRAAAALLVQLGTLGGDAQEDAILDALPALGALDTISWMRLKRQLKACVKSLNLNDLEKARNELRRIAHQQAPAQEAGRSQAQIAATLAQGYVGTLAYDLSRQAWMTYDQGLWRQLETERVAQGIISFMDGYLQGDYTWHDLTGVERLLRTRLAQPLTLETPGWLPLRNGALHLATMILHPHTAERAFTWQLPHSYDPQATCPHTQAWLHETVGQAHDQVQVLRAYAKAVVTRRIDLQRYLETIGPGGTGKGTYTRLLQALVGIDNVFATELKHLEANRFELSNLRGKTLMVITDAERYSGPVNALKAITGQDFVRMEEKFKAQRTEIAPVMVIVSANEPIQSADYTSGLVRRRLSMFFRRRPSEPRDLLSWKDGDWHGELALELPGFLNWVLAMPDAHMEALLQQTTATVPSLKEAWAQSLVDTNPLADWANQVLVREDQQDKDGKPIYVNVGIAKKLDHARGYEHEQLWLYPNYHAWVDATGGKPLSSRRFTGLLKDLLENQLRLEGVVHTDDRNGSRFRGIRLRRYGEYSEPLITEEQPQPVTLVTGSVTGETRTSDGCDACDGFLQSLYKDPPTPCDSDPAHTPRGVGVPIEGVDCKNPVLLSHPSPTRRNGIRDPSPLVTEPLPGDPGTSKTPIAVDDLCYLFAADGAQQNAEPFLCKAIQQGPDGRWYALFLDIPGGWPVEQCEKDNAPPDYAPDTSPTLSETGDYEELVL